MLVYMRYIHAHMHACENLLVFKRARTGLKTSTCCKFPGAKIFATPCTQETVPRRRRRTYMCGENTMLHILRWLWWWCTKQCDRKYTHIKKSHKKS